MVTLPTPHDATSHIARVLHEEGCLGDFVVPLAGPAADSRLKRAVPGQWRYPAPAVSGAILAEAASAAAYGALGRWTRVRGGHALTHWRAAALDRSSVRRLARGGHDGLVVLQARTPRAAAAASRLGVAVIYQANADTWGAEDALNSMALGARSEAERREILGELWRDSAVSVEAAITRSRCVLVESARMERRVRSLPGAPAAVARLGQGVDAEFFRPGARVLKAGPLTVAAVSRIARAKGIRVLDAAAGRAREAVARCVVAGWDGEHVPLLVRSCQGLEFRGGLSRSGVRALLQASDVFVLPTLADSMPRAVLEAMSCGMPVITTRESGYEDLIRDGENGFLVPSGDAGAVAILLTRLAGDPELRRRIGAAARATAEANSWGAFRERFRSALYSELLPAIGRPDCLPRTG